MTRSAQPLTTPPLDVGLRCGRGECTLRAMVLRVAALAVAVVLMCAACGPEVAAPPASPKRTRTAETTEPDPTVNPSSVRAGVFTTGTLCRVAGSAGITSSEAPLLCRPGPDGTLRWQSG